jgi:hypothetical protein
MEKDKKENTKMRKRYLIMMYEGPLDGWRTVNYSDIASANVYDSDEGILKLDDAEKVFELVANNSMGNEPIILVQVLRDNGIETEYK